MSDPVSIDRIWGFEDGVYRAPLPAVGPHTTRIRATLIEECPPYIVASFAGRWGIYVMACEGDGWRANVWGDGPRTLDEGDDSAWIYLDGDNVPKEWHEPIAAALQEIRDHWPGRRLIFDPKETPLARRIS